MSVFLHSKSGTDYSAVCLHVRGNVQEAQALQENKNTGLQKLANSHQASAIMGDLSAQHVIKWIPLQVRHRSGELLGKCYYIWCVELVSGAEISISILWKRTPKQRFSDFSIVYLIIKGKSWTHFVSHELHFWQYINELKDTAITCQSA